jgi:hypothetical protein
MLDGNASAVQIRQALRGVDTGAERHHDCLT